MALKIIDISKFNTVTDWAKVRQSVDGIIIRVAFRGYGSGKISIDPKFETFAEKCNTYGIPFGMYFMSSAISIKEAREEAEYSVYQAKEHNMPAYMPIFIDSEDVDGTAAVRRSDGLTKSARTDVCNAFMETVKGFGYKAGIYCSDSWTTDKLEWNRIKDTGINWIARYAKNNNGNATVKATPCHMHQYTSDGIIPGISGRCDVSNCFIDLKVDQNTKKNTVAVPTVKLGHISENARLLQKNLNEVMEFDIPVTGTVDKLTEAAIILFQHKYMLDADGIYGKKSYAVMDELIKEKQNV